MADPLWIDAVDGEPAYSAAELRRTLGALLYRGSNLLYSARPGVLPLSGVEPLTISGMTVTCADIAVVLSPNLGDPRDGSYLAAIPQTSLSVAPADGALPRLDVVVARVQDDVVDGSGERRAIVDIITGTPASSPSEPNHSGMVRIGTVTVPAGSSTPTVSNNSFTTCANGGILQTRGAQYYPTQNQRQGNYLDDAAADELLRYTGTQWVPVASEIAYRSAIASSRIAQQVVSASSTQNTQNTWESLSGGPAVTVDVGSNGIAVVHFGAQYVFGDADTSQARLAQLRVIYTGANNGNTGGNSWEGRNNARGGSPAQNYTQAFTTTEMITGLAPGSTTFRLQYYQSSPNGCTWASKRLIVEPK